MLASVTKVRGGHQAGAGVIASPMVEKTVKHGWGCPSNRGLGRPSSKGEGDRLTEG